MDNHFCPLLITLTAFLVGVSSFPLVVNGSLHVVAEDALTASVSLVENSSSFRQLFSTGSTSSFPFSSSVDFCTTTCLVGRPDYRNEYICDIAHSVIISKIHLSCIEDLPQSVIDVIRFTFPLFSRQPPCGHSHLVKVKS